MSFIHFESAREKDKLRQELREAREQMLEKAKERAELRIQRETERELRGERDWMLPELAAKINKLHKSSKSSKKSKKKLAKKKKSKKSKTSKKHTKKRKKYSSTSSDTSSDSDSSKEEDNEAPRKSAKESKNNKHKRKCNETLSNIDSLSDKKLKTSIFSSSSESESKSANDNADEWVERHPETNTINASNIIQRDSWMTEPVLLKTFARERKEKDPSDQQNIDAYDPAKSTRELNPYWKSTGTGLPAFQKPADDYDKNIEKRIQSVSHSGGGGGGGWRKQQANETKLKSSTLSSAPSSLSEINDVVETSSSSSSEASADEEAAEVNTFLTDQQMNELGAKLLKAEIMGNSALAAELKEKLENARQNRANVKNRKSEKSFNYKQNKTSKTEEENVLLTRTDERGNARPLAQASRNVDQRELYGGRSGRKKQKRIDTHLDGERVRYFPDDDKYDIKQMFEREKYTSAGESNLQFASIASKHKNPNDDLDDIFADKVRKDISQEDTDRKEMQRAINEHKRLTAQLESCTRCFDSPKMDKSLLVSMGEKVYLSLPWHIGLQPGHCIIAPTQHSSCCTQLDEDTWSELNDFRKALTNMFTAQRKDVIFFEIANKLQRRPHLTIHCIPIPDSEAEMAPFYFKKAIEESEHEWSVNKQLVSLRGKSLRSCIPKGLPYFWVNFGMDTGFAHVIEDEDRFPVNFAQEIISGMLQLDANKWRRHQKEQNSIAKVKIFADWWKKFDCTK